MKHAIKRLGLAAAVLGLVIAGASQARADVNLILNGSFETGDFTDWTLFGNTGYTGVAGNFAGVNPEDGGYQAYFGPVGSTGGISQTITTTVGATYDISFWLYNFGGTPSEYSAQFGTTVLTDVVNPDPFDYTQFSFVATATAAETGFTAFSFEQNPAYFLLDNIVITAAAIVPEPSTLAISGVSGLLAVGYGALRRRRKAMSGA